MGSDKVTRIAIVGAGAIGATVGAWLTTNSQLEVTFCVRSHFDRLHVETPSRVIDTVPGLLSEVAQAAPVDWVIVATKTYDAAGAATWIDALTGPATRLAILQNGVEHLTRFTTPGRDRQVPAIVDIPAERQALGRVLQRRDGSILIPADDNGRAFAALFRDTPIDVQPIADWQSAAWRKLAINCAGAVNALTLKPAGIAAEEDIAELMRALVRECVAVGRAEGATLGDTLPDEVVAGYRASDPDSVNSIHADRQAGRQTEADARNGVIARLAARNGLTAPLNAMAHVLLTAR
ncbi:2-dehydropantoate 2-reductase [Croceibacterium sp. TMG7-5b_MA50]|uniref:2-dehydropantoate 2-reductase n=1 Tax=Croceibacterium sp. TMG7-5b_MA50 TaxID=3121290 RepID=UPI003221B4E0